MQLFYVFWLEGNGPAHLMGREADLGEVLYGLSLHKRVDEGDAISEEAMVREQDRVVIWDEWFKAGAHFVRTGGCVGGERDESGGHDDLGADGLIEGGPAGREGGGDGRVRVDDSVDVRAHAIDGEVHPDLAGDFA